MLIETPYQMLPLGWEQVFFAIASRGYTVLLAHPERCTQLADKPMLFDAFIEKGIYLQINWDSFLGYQGRETARRLSENRLIGPFSRNNFGIILKDMRL